MRDSERRERSLDTTESKTLSMCGSSMRENRETPQTPTVDGGVGRSKKAKSGNFDTHVCGESDVHLVPTKRANKVSTRERGGGGVRGGKERDQGERTTGALAPDTEPGMRVIGVVARTTTFIYINERLIVTHPR